MDVFLIHDVSSLDLIVPILLQLRPTFEPGQLKKQIIRQQEKGYQLAYVEHDHHAVAGFVITE
ncbi:MAG: hypothetical protein CENE_03454 [Candidatus Celerinatantimonas neptuna]|nr:MAG: hypothetical protein CENE_03454 [Candidatus Celerinatantimonas neptuna]